MSDPNYDSEIGNVQQRNVNHNDDVYNNDVPMDNEASEAGVSHVDVNPPPSTMIKLDRSSSERLEALQYDRIRRNRPPVNSLVRQPSESTDEGFDAMDEQERRDTLIENESMKREGQRVTCLKLLVILILVASAVIIALIAYLYITNSEEKQFIKKFRIDANKVLESIGSSFDRTLGTMNAIAIILVSNAHDQQHPWPFMTLPDFALHASKLIPLTDGLFLSVLPIVYPHQKQEWEDYALEQDYWVNESLAVQEVWDGYHGNITYDWARSESIYGVFGEIDSNVRYDTSNRRSLFLVWWGMRNLLED